ncbi:MAG TPA: TcpQ domain-containing protein [Alphaproteobacteria bacterium]|nr:TcpQ domain-containing protein [Alphaproteobacteria bacterium]
MPLSASDDIKPVIIEGRAPARTTSVVTQAPTPLIETAPVSSAPAPVSVPVTPSRESSMVMHPLLPPPSATTTTATTTVSTTTTDSGPVVRGFAKEVPLAVALRQILPPGYGFSVDPDVDLGVLISFKGGKPWRQTLADALDPAGLVMREKGQMISIGRIGSQPTPVNTAERMPPTMTPSAPAHILEPPGEMPVVPMRAISTSPAAQQEAAPVADSWVASRGDSLHKVLEGWARRSNVELNWMAEYDYPIQASFTYSGYFEDAMRAILTGFEEAHPEPVAELHNNPGLGQRVLVVQTRGNSYSD